jgi:predicted RNA-binding Zn-ribbon protein involved in translation (DUF1610 family)
MLKALPRELAREWERVYQGIRQAHPELSAEQAARLAWAVVKRLGWRKRNGHWVLDRTAACEAKDVEKRPKEVGNMEEPLDYGLELQAAQRRGELMLFSGRLVRAEVNRNLDEIPAEELPAIAETARLMPVTVEHENRPVGFISRAWVQGDYVHIEAALWARRFKEVALDVMAGARKLSIDAVAERVECPACGRVAQTRAELCEHLAPPPPTRSTPRRLRGIRVVGAGLVRNPAGTGTEVDPDSILLVAAALDGDTEEVEARKLTYEERQDLPDSAFALVYEEDGKKVRKFPIHDIEHARNALARLDQADITDEQKATVLRKILERWGDELSDESVQNIKERLRKLTASEAETQPSEAEPGARANEESVGTVTATPGREVELEARLAGLQAEVERLTSELRLKELMLRRGLVLMEALRSREEVERRLPLAASLDDDKFELYLEDLRASRLAAAGPSGTAGVRAFLHTEDPGPPVPLSFRRLTWKVEGGS